MPKGFQKGNKLACVQKGKPKAKTQAWNNIVGYLVGDGGMAFKQKIESLSVGAEITKEEKEFLQHYKDLLEYHQPKLARTELTGKDGKDLQIELIKYGKNKDSV